METIKDLVSTTEWALVYAKLSGEEVVLVDDKEDIRYLKGKAYNSRRPTKPMSRNTINRIDRTLDMFSDDGIKEARRKNAKRLKHEKMIADKNALKRR